MRLKTIQESIDSEDGQTPEEYLKSKYGLEPSDLDLVPGEFDIEEVDRLAEKFDLQTNEAAKSTTSDTYFNSQSEALDAAFAKAMKKGYEVVIPDNIWTEHVAYGSTVKYELDLTKGGKPDKNRKLQIQLYRMDSGKYELNAYVT